MSQCNLNAEDFCKSYPRCEGCGAHGANEMYTFIGGRRGGGKIFHLEQRLAYMDKELKAVKEDRDYWMRLAESAIQQIKRMAERQIK